MFLIYRPLARIMEERRKKIEFGLRGAEEAEKIIKEAEDARRAKVAEAEKRAISILGLAEENAGARSREIIAKAEARSANELLEAEKAAERKRIELMGKIEEEARALVRDAIIKTVELAPEKIDEKLIEEAVRAMKDGRLKRHEI